MPVTAAMRKQTRYPRDIRTTRSMPVWVSTSTTNSRYRASKSGAVPIGTAPLVRCARTRGLLHLTLTDNAANRRRRVRAVAPDAVEAVVIAVEPEREPARTVRSGPLRADFILVLYAPLISTGPVRQTTAIRSPWPDCVQRIVPMNALGPPAPVTVHDPAAVIGEGGSTLFATNEPLALRPL